MEGIHTASWHAFDVKRIFYTPSIAKEILSKSLPTALCPPSGHAWEDKPLTHAI